MKKITSILCLLLFTTSIFTQDIDNKSKAILDNLSAKTKAYNTLYIEFQYKMENKTEGINETIDGVLRMKKDKYTLSFGEQIIVCDGETVWTYLKDLNEVHIGTNEEDIEGAISPQNIFSLYESGHRSKYMREGTIEGKKVHVIELVPIEPQSYHKVRLNIDKETNMLVSAIVFDRNQNTFAYEIKKHTPNTPMADDIFKFNTSKYQGIEIIDLR